MTHNPSLRHSHNYSWEERQVACDEPHKGKLMGAAYEVIDPGTFDAAVDLHIAPGFGSFLKMDGIESVEIVYVQRGGRRIRVTHTRHGAMSGPA
jgi:hypothetical protein